jgi:hypothetical protein
VLIRQKATHNEMIVLFNCCARFNEYKNYRKIYIDMYILYSVVISTLIFAVYQYIDSLNRDNNVQPYDINRDLFTINNIMIYMLIVSVVFFIIYMAFSDDVDIFSSLGVFDNDNNSYEIKKNNVNPSIFRNTTFPMKMGFEPYNSGGSKSNSGSDQSSVASSECSGESE